MHARLGLAKRSFAGFLLLASLFLVTIAWAITEMAISGPIAREVGVPWIWIVGGLLASAGLVVLAVRPILIPWAVVNVHRGYRRVFARNVRFEPPPFPMIQLPPTDELVEGLARSEEAAELDQKVQRMLDAARSTDPPPISAELKTRP
jgi:hypothetical protein